MLWCLIAGGVVALAAVGVTAYFMFGGGDVGGVLDSVGLGGSPKALYPQAGDAGGKKRYGYVDEKGAWAIKPQYTYAGLFDEILDGHAVIHIPSGRGIQTGYKLHLIDKSGKQAIDLSRYKEIKPFSEGLAAVRITRRRWGYLDTTGKEVIPLQYLEAGNFSDGLAFVRRKKDAGGFDIDYVYIDKKGSVVLGGESEFKYGSTFSDGIAAVRFSDKADNVAWGLIDKKGGIVLEPAYAHTSPPREGLVCVKKQTSGPGIVAKFASGYVDLQGREVIPCKFDNAAPFSEGLAAVAKTVSGKVLWGFIDKNGATVVPFTYVNVLSFSEGLAAVYVTRREFAFINKAGNMVIGPHEGYVLSSFKNGIARCSANIAVGMGPYFTLDKTGKELSRDQ